MKNKRNVLIAFILICCLCLSIGYAALTDTLYTDGTITIDAIGNADDNNDTPVERAFDQDVYFSAAVISVSGAKANGNVQGLSAVIGHSSDAGDDVNDPESEGVSDQDLLTITIPSGVLNAYSATNTDTVTVTATIKNASEDLGAKVTLNTAIESLNSENDFTHDYFDVTAIWADTEIKNSDGSVTIAANGTATVIYTIALTETPNEDITNLTFAFMFDVEAVSPDT